MKKLISILLAGAMALGSVSMVSAADPANLKELMDQENIPVPYLLSYDVDTDIQVKDTGAYADSLSLTLSSNMTADYKTTMYMQVVRDKFTELVTKAEDKITKKGGANAATLQAELDAAPVYGEFEIKVILDDGMEIPADMKADSKALKGFSANVSNVFEEVSRTYSDVDKTLTIKIATKAITKAELEADLDEYLADFTLECEDVIITGEGVHTVKGTVTGFTKIGDDIAVINYKAVQQGDKTADIKADVDVSTGVTRPPVTGGSDITTITVKVEVDGKVIERKTSSTGIEFDPYSLDVPEKEGHLFAGWYNKETGAKVEGGNTYNSSMTIYAKWIPTGDVDVTFEVEGEEAEVNGKDVNGVVVPEDAVEVTEEGTKLAIGDIKPVLESGKKFVGWYLDAEFTTPADEDAVYTEDVKLYAKVIDAGDILDKDNHYAYIMGYEDGTVKAEKNISREEVATIFFRVMKDDIRANIMTTENDFTDVAEDRWSNCAISTIANYGIITGYQDGTFKPQKSITRAEFVTMAARFAEIDENATAEFTDIAGHWAEKNIKTAVALGWIDGYEDGTFKPDKNITRAEAITIVNKILDRKVDQDGLHADAVIWSDLSVDDWYYYNVIEATNAHKYEAGVNAEKWTECIENFDWTTLEK